MGGVAKVDIVVAIYFDFTNMIGFVEGTSGWENFRPIAVHDRIRLDSSYHQHLPPYYYYCCCYCYYYLLLLLLLLLTLLLLLLLLLLHFAILLLLRTISSTSS